MKTTSAALILLALALAPSALADRLDTRLVVGMLGDAIFDEGILSGDEGNLTVDGEPAGPCRVTKTQDDRHFGYVYRIMKADRSVAFSTIWPMKSSVDGEWSKIGQRLTLQAKIENPNTSVRAENLTVERDGKSLRVTISHVFKSGHERSVSCTIL